MLVSASEQLVVLPDGEHYKNVLDPAAAERTAEWTTDYFNTPPEKEKKKMSKGAKTALGILGAIILGKAIHEATDDDVDDDRRRSPPTSPEPEYPEPEVSKPPAGDPESTTTTDARQPHRVARQPADDMRRTSPDTRLGPGRV